MANIRWPSGRAPFRGYELRCSQCGQTHRPRRAGPACWSGTSHVAHVPGSAGSVTSLRSPHAGQTRTLLGCRRFAASRYPGNKIDRLFAGRTVDRLYPEERFYGYLCVAVARAGRTIVLPDLVVQRLDEGSCGPFIRRHVEMLDLLANDPGRHRIDVKSLHVATETVRFDQRGSAAHKRISDSTTREVVGGKERVLQRALPELGKDQTTKQRARTPREPFVNADDRAIILLDLLFPEGQSGDHRNVEVSLDTHVPSCRVGETSAQTGSLNE